MASPSYMASPKIENNKDSLVSDTRPVKKVDGSLRELVKNKRHLRNLLILMFLWIVSAFDYYLINF